MTTLTPLDLATLSAGDVATVVAAVVAVMTLVLGVGGTFIRWLGYRRLLREAVYEAGHNLFHIAQTPFDLSQQTFTAWPEFYVARATELMAARNLAWIIHRERLAADVDHMLRNADHIRRFAFDADGLRSASVNIGYFVEHTVRFLLHARELNSGAEVLRKLGLAELITARSPHFRFLLRDAEADARGEQHGARRDGQLIYWAGEPSAPACRSAPAPLHLAARFERMQDPPPHGTRPELSSL